MKKQISSGPKSLRKKVITSIKYSPNKAVIKKTKEVGMTMLAEAVKVNLVEDDELLSEGAVPINS